MCMFSVPLLSTNACFLVRHESMYSYWTKSCAIMLHNPTCVLVELKRVVSWWTRLLQYMFSWHKTIRIQACWTRRHAIWLSIVEREHVYFIKQHYMCLSKETCYLVGRDWMCSCWNWTHVLLSNQDDIAILATQEHMYYCSTRTRYMYCCSTRTDALFFESTKHSKE